MRNQPTKLPAQPTTQPDQVQPVPMDYLESELRRLAPAMIEYHRLTGKVADWWLTNQFKIAFTTRDDEMNMLLAFTWCRQTNHDERKLLRKVFDVPISTQESFAYSAGWGATIFTWPTTPDTPAPPEQLNMFQVNSNQHNYREV